MILINYAHPLTPSQQSEAEAIAGQSVERIIEIKAQFDSTQPFGEQIRNLIDQTGLTAHDWQILPLIINLPSLSVIAALLLAEIHGRTGYFPAILRLRPVVNTTPPQFEVAEIINLQSVREQSRQAR